MRSFWGSDLAPLGSDLVIWGVRFGHLGSISGSQMSDLRISGSIWRSQDLRCQDLRMPDVRSQDLGVDLAISGSRGQISGSQMSPFGVVLGPKRGRFWTLFSSKQCFSIKRQNSVFAVFG